MGRDAGLCQGTGVSIVRWWGAVPTPQIIPILRNLKLASAAWSPNELDGWCLIGVLNAMATVTAATLQRLLGVTSGVPKTGGMATTKVLEFWTAGGNLQESYWSSFKFVSTKKRTASTKCQKIVYRVAFGQPEIQPCCDLQFFANLAWTF